MLQFCYTYTLNVQLPYINQHKKKVQPPFMNQNIKILWSRRQNQLFLDCLNFKTNNYGDLQNLQKVHCYWSWLLGVKTIRVIKQHVLSKDNNTTKWYKLSIIIKKWVKLVIWLKAPVNYLYIWITINLLFIRYY